MSHAHDHENTIPRPALVSAIAFVGVSFLLTLAVTFGFIDRAAVPSVERAQANVSAVAERDLRFLDQEDGSVIVTDVSNGDTVIVVDTETQSGGFVRGVLRGLARERRAHGIGAEPPFALTMWEDGSLSIADSATGRTLELGGFGPDNRAIFVSMLDDGSVS
ncbi:photosynthetic complex assembly protein PuhC [Aurantiacibacter sediminis]|uniref:Phosphonoacetaldehyde methylase n=1 Tax=Aurantiacibacter sediminis TaxID=2793064 RepID=A0ABS0N1Y2_9SPHN|nr:photosynthetic complex assembly protein PuhC [Aurantiacibacter sediminis]MBH5321964.1 hypothetical protein [Aurantiacibacter sediminis]